MNRILNQNLFFVKEHIGFFKAANNYDIYDPQTDQLIMECREDSLGRITKLLRFTDFKRMTPFDIKLRTTSGEPILRITRGVTWIRSKVSVLDETEKYVGGFHQRLFSIGGSFSVMDRDENLAFTLKGKWTKWDFQFMSGDTELAKVTKKWAGFRKELLTTADNYAISISEDVPSGDPVRQLIIASALCIDMVHKE